METRFITYPHYQKREDFPPTVMALGYFDGVHLGHQEVIRTAVHLAAENGYKSAVMTFHPHPSIVLGKKEQHVQLITPLKEKERQMARLGVDYLYIVEFTPSFAELLPQQFVDEYIIDFHVKHVVAGFDFTYGRLGKGTMETIPFHSREQFAHTVIPKLTRNGEKISSTYIRRLLKDGEVQQLPELLGRFYTIEGTVIDGEKRGRTIGFPTANIEPEDDYLLPALGVYAVKVRIGNETFAGVCNVGYKPTFHRDRQGRPSIEVHIFHFSREIYGETVTIEWHKRLRSEQKFASVEQLVEQIERDKERAEDYFRKIKENTCILPRKDVF
ncbi:riboflavin biosynthesis protein RibF [Anoxybacillus sp. B7M1]|jgi:riboflavin kinase / FMN adenylyltransferase|uniref:Riboflavin biosynthesis protein n=1 Tax=Anoxybacteroides rupiense TaxID=311460 RepID=A0ABD5IS52_9BACL|nr:MULTISPECIES: bifunctional riboflavin kinase/FAD synthetase [Anoxybacillus]ANB58889.1 riboflavin biosynthesis protein RibF [Anoxybacillus sp. B2M1]ANB63349.1 riboflavin biosynthesis protein RibF [Anoxybacillus sp. B7M1]KXG10595.1 Riboflavin biosynthesis protein RibF [Anoxybacillus sp. P3H1B]MBB3906121.1 riboflavin kinase/FMN adenylyltransferase [Anoxybacillus rupiensis]MBS2771054.1 bifunctional riboflavin kinase/FAD synthetase [Anoxybacillus rupiensis]